MSTGTDANRGTAEQDMQRGELISRVDELLKKMLRLREMHGHVDSWLMAGEMHWFYSTCEKLIELYTQEEREIAGQIEELMNSLHVVGREKMKGGIFTSRSEG